MTYPPLYLYPQRHPPPRSPGLLQPRRLQPLLAWARGIRSRCWRGRPRFESDHHDLRLAGPRRGAQGRRPRGRGQDPASAAWSADVVAGGARLGAARARPPDDIASLPRPLLGFVGVRRRPARLETIDPSERGYSPRRRSSWSARRTFKSRTPGTTRLTSVAWLVPTSTPWGGGPSRRSTFTTARSTSV